jgi:hypothetical protein
MKVLKVVAYVLLGYAVLVAVLDVVVGIVQPDMDVGVLLSTTDSEGRTSDRMLAGVRMDDHIYVSANHWTRFWYYRALVNPAVEVTVNGKRGRYTAVPVTGDELDRIAAKYQMGFVLRFLTGFAPQRFVRLDPR